MGASEARTWRRSNQGSTPPRWLSGLTAVALACALSLTTAPTALAEDPPPPTITESQSALPSPDPTEAQSTLPSPTPTEAQSTLPSPTPTDTVQESDATATTDAATPSDTVSAQTPVQPAASETNAPVSDSPTITTDKADYAPGETVTITGAGWAGGEAVHIYVNDESSKSWSLNSNPDPVAKADGSFLYVFTLPTWFVANYTAKATGLTSGRTATVDFTDLNIGAYNQCSNDQGAGYSTGDTGCRWINGNLQSNNSRYYEGDATVQRLWLTDLTPGSTHTVTLKYGTTKGGTHAYDFLTSWNWSENWITLADRCEDIGGCTDAAEATLAMKPDPNAAGYDVATGTRLFTMRGATPTATTTPTIVSGSYSGDSETAVTVTFTVGASNGSMCSTKNGVTTCDVALWFGAHVAAQANWGLGLGAGSISGSPYHVALDAIDGGSIGQRDNQMDAKVVTFVPNGTIVIVKDAVPDNAQDFAFNLNNGGTITQDFSLDDDADPTLPNSQTFSVPPGTWTATEALTTLAHGWTLSNIVCADPTNNSTVNVGTGTATIALASSETVTCTYTNNYNSQIDYGRILVKKVTTSGDGTFEFDPSWSGTNFTLSNGDTEDSGLVAPGTYSVEEVALPAGWALSSATCSDGSSVDEIQVGINETVTCTFTNEPVSDLTVTKTATTSYTRTFDWTITKSADKATVYSAGGGESEPVTYTVAVTKDAGTDSAWAVSGTITVHNPNSFDVTGVNLTDSATGGSCIVTDGQGLTVPAGGDSTADYTCTFAVDPGAGTNTATATWDQAEVNTPSGSATGEAAYKFLDPTTVVNDTIDVTDTNGGGWSFDDTDSVTYSTTYTDPAGTCTTHENTATITQLDKSASVTVTDCQGADLTITKTAAGSLSRLYKWTIDKDVDQTTVNIADGGTATFNYTVTVTPDGYTDSGHALAGDITLTNPNDWQDVTVEVTDTLDTGGTCTITETSPYVVPKSDTLVLHYTCTTDGTTTTNTATATWDKTTFHTPNDSASATTDVTFAVTGETNKIITVTDDQTDPNNPVILGTADWTNGPTTFTYSLNKAGVAGTCTDYTNTATIDQTDWSDKQTVTVCVGKDLTITKTATPSFFRDWTWSITKDADKSYDLFAGESVTHDYTVSVTPTATDSGWVVTGMITVANPNNWENITATLTDLVDNGGTCTVNKASVTVPAGSSVEVPYSCSWLDSAPTSASGTNTATAIWSASTYATPSGSATGTAPFAFTNPTEKNPVITVDDSNLEGENWSADRAPESWTYTKDFACPTDPSVYKGGSFGYSVTNTATVDPTYDYDTATVDVTCHAPVVTKTAQTYWNRDWTWSITKDYDATYTIFAGDTVTHGYQVAANPTSSDNGWGVKGTITVANSHPTESMTLTSLTDLAGGIAGVVTCESLVVPADSSLTCSYDTGAQVGPATNPFGDTNTATAGFAGADWTGTAPIAFSITPTTEDDPTVTVDDDNLTGETWSADRASAQWTYTKGLSCSSNPEDYSDGTYSYSHTNTATITETGQSDTATVGVTCYWPQVELTKTGDTLSKIGDGVTYGFTLENRTPTVAGLRALSCDLGDPLIGFTKHVTLASGATDTSSVPFTVPAGAADPFVNTASVTCTPVAATAPVVGSSTFAVNDTSSWSTNLFQPGVRVDKTGPAYATSGDTVTYTFTITNTSSTDSPNLVLNSVTDTVLGDLADEAPASCDELASGASCTFTATYTVPDVGIQPRTITNVVTVHYHPAGFPNDITDTDTHTVTAAPRSQLTDTSFCPLPNNQFRLLYHLETSPNVYRLQASNPGQFYMNGFYTGTPGSTFTMSLRIPYPFVTQEGAGNPIQVHDGTALTSSGCYVPTPSLSGYSITTQAMTPTSSAGNQIITALDYTTKNLGSTTTVTVSGKVPATGIAYVTIHLDYGLKRTGSWKLPGTLTTNPVGGASIPDATNQTGFGSGPVTIKGYQEYVFSRTVGSDTATTTPASYNEIKKFAGFLGFVVNRSTGQPVANTKVTIYDPSNKLLTTQYTDADGYYMYAYKHTAKSATYTVKVPAYTKSTSVLVKANGFAGVNFDVP